MSDVNVTITEQAVTVGVPDTFELVASGTYAQMIAGLTGASLGDYPEVVNTSVATNLITRTITANTMDLGSTLRLTAGGTVTNNSGANVDLDVAIPYGVGYAITAGGGTQTLTTSTNPRKWYLDLLFTQLYEDDTTNNTGDLTVSGTFFTTFPGTGEWRPLFTGGLVIAGDAETVRPPTIDNDIGIEVTFSVADPAISIDLRTFQLVHFGAVGADLG